MSGFWQDLRYGAHTLAKSPGFLLVAVLSLGLGIGANTAIFSLINAVMLRMLPVSHPERLVLLTDPGSSGVNTETIENGVRSILSYPEFQELRARNVVFSGLFAAASSLTTLDVSTREGASLPSIKAQAQLVSGEFFEVLGVQPIIGRAFTPKEDQAFGANPVAVISYAFWQRAFAADPAIVGKTIRAAQGNFQILGVTPPAFRGMLVGADTDFWVPITMQEQLLPGRSYLKPRDTLWLQVMARLKPEMSRKTAESGVNVTFQQIMHNWAGSLPTERERRELLDQKIQLSDGARGASFLRGQFSDPLVLLMIMVGLVLLIACANIANLTLARASGRQREVGVRLALGAGRARLIRQLLTESLLVAALGGVVGAFLAVWGTDLLLALGSAGIDGVDLDTSTDLRVFVFTAVISFATGILFGLMPAIRATKVDVNQTLGANARGAIGGLGRIKTGRLLVVAQVALSLLLLMGATLFVRSLRNILDQNLGFNREHLLTLRVDPVAGGYQGASVPALYQQVREKLLAIPGVRSASLTNAGFFLGDSGDQISFDGHVTFPEKELHAWWTLVGPDYFSTVGIPLLRGREIDSNDAARGAAVCVINESFARFFFPDSNPIGRHLTDEYPTTRITYEIVGVVADAQEHRFRREPEKRFYANIAHPIGTVDRVTFVMSASGSMSSIVPSVRRVMSESFSALPVINIRTVTEQIDRRLVFQRVVAELAAFFGGLALLMAAIGLYGVMSYSMSRRTSEIGIRMALGASEGSVLWLVLRETLVLVLAGVAIGLPCAIASGKLIANRLVGITATDPTTILLAVGIIFTATLLAGYLPARRAAHTDPMQALRSE